MIITTVCINHGIIAQSKKLTSASSYASRHNTYNDCDNEDIGFIVELEK